MLKYLPSDKAQDARNFMLSLQYWLGGNSENLENFLLNLAGQYVPSLKGVDLGKVKTLNLASSNCFTPRPPFPCLPLSARTALPLRLQQPSPRLLLTFSTFCRPQVEEPQTFPDLGIWHPTAPTMYEDIKEYLNWYDTRKDQPFEKDAPIIGLVLQRSHLVTGDEGHYSVRALPTGSPPIAAPPATTPASCHVPTRGSAPFFAAANCAAVPTTR